MTEADSEVSSRGRTAARAARGRARRSPKYRAAREEYAAIRALRERNWIAAHIRERRYELNLTQQELARRAGTSHSYISKLEGGAHIPTIPVLTRILAVLDEQLLIGIERKASGQVPEREFVLALEFERLIETIPQAPTVSMDSNVLAARPGPGRQERNHCDGQGNIVSDLTLLEGI